MDSQLTCTSCHKLYNKDAKLPKVLPCSDIACLECLSTNSKRFTNEFLYTCTSCSKELTLPNFENLPTNTLALYCLENNQNVQKLKYNPKIENTEINKHYDNIINSIDIRTESLISFICSSRETFINQVNDERKKSITKMQELGNSSIFETINKNLDDFNNDKMSSLISNYSKLVQLKNDFKKNLWYFDENSIKNDKSLLGFMLNKNMNRNYLKIKNLHLTFNKTEENFNNDSVRVHLKTSNNYAEMSIRQYIIPMSRNKIIKVYFTTKRSIFLEVFNSTGESISSIKAFDNLSSFPVAFSHGDHLCLTFTAKLKGNSNLFDMNQNFVLLYNSDLKCLKTVKKFASIESVFMNDKNIFLFYTHKTIGCCEMMDYELNEIETFGQQTDPEGDFYMEKTDLHWKEQNASGLKNNPKIFGFTEDQIYFFNRNQMVIMNRHTGKVIKSIESNGDPAYFVLDPHGNIIKVNSLCKRIVLLNYENDISITNRYADCFDDVFLTNDNYLVFVDKNKEFVNFV